MKYFVIILFLIMANSTQAQPATYYGGDDGEKLDWVLHYLKNYYVNDVDGKYLVEQAIKSMMKELDPWSKYQTAEELEALQNSYKGFGKAAYGFNYYWVKDRFMITYVHPGGPADNAEIKVNDRIIAVNEITVNLDNYTKIQGEIHNEDTVIQLNIERPDASTKNISLTKAMLPVISVQAVYAINAQTAYAKISRFNDNTIDEFEQGMKPLIKKGVENIIIDLRGNYGGSVEGAIELSDAFLPKDKLITYAQGFNMERKDYLTAKPHTMKGVRLVIIVDENTMSAAEMFALAMQDYDRALIVGLESYGKGLIQNSHTLNDSSAVRFTTGKYYSPTGRHVDQLADKNNDWLDSLVQNSYTIDATFNEDVLHKTIGGRKIAVSNTGVVPDIFFKMVNTQSRQLMLLNGKHLLHDFAYKYVFDEQLNLVKKYNNVKVFDADAAFKKKLKQQLLPFIQQEVATRQLDVNIVPKTITDDMLMQVQAVIASLTWSNDAYYYLYHQNDLTIQRCATAFEDGSFERLGIE